MADNTFKKSLAAGTSAEGGSLWFIFILIAASMLALAGEGAKVTFTDVTDQAGIDYLHRNSATKDKNLIETMGGGCAFLDYNNDGRLDIFFVNSALITYEPGKQSPPFDKSAKEYWNRLYRNNGDGTFTDVTEESGLKGYGYGMGIAVGDYDNDGFSDIYVTNYGPNILYHNNGDGTFTDVTAQAGVAAGGWSSSSGFFDYDHDGDLDLFVVRYLDWTFENNIWCGERKPGYRSYCHPNQFKGMPNILYRNNGDGTFTDVSEGAGIANPEGKGLGVAFADYNNDDWIDVYVANDSVRCFLYRNNGDGTFTDAGLLSGAELNESGKTFAGMGIDFNDYDNDGLPDIFVTTLSNEMYVLFRNNGDGTFSDVTTATGIGEITLTYSGWGTKFFDYDNDGLKDIFIANSHVMDNVQLYYSHLTYMMRPLLLKNVGGKFRNVSSEMGAAFAQSWAGRGAAFGDYDNDGDVDILVSNLNQRTYLLRNEGGNRNNWIALELIGTRSNRDAIGAKIRLTSSSGLVQYNHVTTASSYLSANDKRVYFGLGQDKEVKSIEILWPSKIKQRLGGAKANQILKIKEQQTE